MPIELTRPMVPGISDTGVNNLARETKAGSGSDLWPPIYTLTTIQG